MIAGVFLKKKYNAKLVFDAHELAAHEDDRHHIFRRMFKRLLMRRLVKHADRIVTVSQGFDHWFTDKFGKPVLVVYNTPQIADESELDMTVRGAAGLTEDDPLIVYIGGVNERRGSKQMGQAARLLPEHFKLVFVTGAKPHIREQILTEAARDPIEGKGAEIIFLPPVPAKEVVHQSPAATSLLQSAARIFHAKQIV
jgi:glycosyltransferase involved in cell wall biosynthesis